jgi:hypothetical protein
MTTSLAEGLLADEPLAAESARLALFGQFVGAWDLEWHGPGRDGSEIVIAGELHFGWILGGRAVQDVWRVPSSPSDAGLMRGFHGSTIRFYDAAIDAWRSNLAQSAQRQRAPLHRTTDRRRHRARWSR